MTSAPIDPADTSSPSGSAPARAPASAPDRARGAVARAPGPVARALAVLAAFESTPGPLSVGRIVEETGLPVSTTYRLVHELQEWGVLDRTADGSYQVGMRIWELGQQAGRRLRDRAHPFMQDLFDTTHENVHLAVREGTEALYVDKLYGSRRVPLASRIGSRLPLHPTAVGRILLANQPSWFREAYLERELEHPTPKTQTGAATLAKELALVREQGHAVTIDEMRLGACSIAVPISHGGQVVAAVGIVLESHRASEVPWLLNQLKATGYQIERALDRRITIR
ncbi:IclR family transcriptional regulator [Marisediminicola antarctica]|uniref:IclR family transcriptional regulator n=1 Tax=Marisediminicola antarctica TaxID=674079 RepID=UPI0013795F36|nr:IclR family transcriptional regulator [Marisediminicola antarctica]